MSAKVTLPSFRISPAALGRRLASVIIKAREGRLSPEEFADTVNAVYDSCLAGDSAPVAGPDTDNEILASEQVEIEKSVRRSEAARRSAAKRRLMREQSAVIVAVDEPVSEEETACASPDVTAPKKKRRRRNRRRRKNHAQ